MNYIDKIEAYTTGEMTALEQLVFEQELAENGSLKEAFDAHQLMEALLGFTANNLSEAAILGNAPISQTLATSGGASKSIYYGASLLTLCLIGLFTFIYTSSSKTDTSSATLDTEQAISTPDIPTLPNQTVKETIIFQDPIQEIQTVQKPAPKPTPSKVTIKKSNKPKPVAAVIKKVQPVDLPIKKTAPHLANLSSSKQVNNGEAIVFTAGESITLEPGFIVEAGGSFQAVIEGKALNK